MTTKINRLSATKIAKTSEPGVYADGGGLYLQVSKWGTKSWLLRYTLDGRSRYMGLGGVSVFTLAEARERARGARQLLADGIDPIEERRRKKAATRAEAARSVTFREAGTRYVAAHRSDWKSERHAQQWRVTLEQYAYPVLGDLLVDQIDTAHVVRVLEPLWLDKVETASRLRGRIELVLNWSVAAGYRAGGDNPARWRGHLDHLLAKPSKVARKQHFAALPYSEVPAFMARLRAIDSTPPARALEFAILTAARRGEIIGATWGEVDVTTAVWTVPAKRMKADRDHRVPLCDRALQILGKPGGDPTDFLFPASNGRPLQSNSLLETLRTLTDVATTHGFRSSFRDWVSEATGFSGELAEAALAHTTGDATERAYRRGDAIEKRRKLMEAWSRYCTENPAEGGKVVPVQGRA